VSPVLASPEQVVPAAQALRVPSVAVNLLPVEIVYSRRGRRARRLTLAALIVFAGLLGGWAVQARQETSAARDDLVSAQQAAQYLIRQQHAYTGVVDVQAKSKAISTQLAALLADDLPWSGLLGAVQAAAPDGVRISGLSATLSSDAARAGGAGGAATAQLAGGGNRTVIGSLTITGFAGGEAEVAAYADALTPLRGLGNPLPAGAMRQGAALAFTLHVDITRDAVGGRYTPAAGTSAGSQ
jgi:Tfp pilus assembly protein PilN